MAKNLYYLDSCIWLNLFKKEGNPAKGIPYWKIAEDFINKVIFSKDKKIIYSGFVLKEIQFSLKNDELFKCRLDFIKGEEKFKRANVTREDYFFARKLESQSNFSISFYDCIHTSLCRRLNFVLVTRDNDLIKFAKNHIAVFKPENLLP